MEAVTILVTGLGLAVAAGLNAYIPLLIAGLLIRYGVCTFAAPYDFLGTAPALVLIAALLVVEVLGDRFRTFHSVDELIQTFIRPAAGAVLFAGAALGIDPDWPQALALVLGLGTAAGVHATRVAVRPTATVPSGPVVSTVDDGFSAGLSAAALLAPLLVLLLLAGLAYWLLSATRRRAAAD